MEDSKQIIYERYLFKLSGSEEKRKSLKPKKNNWKQKYFVIYYENDTLTLCYYDKKPNDAGADPKGKMSLWPAYRITKIDVDKHACEIMTQINRMCVASNDQTTIDELVFHLQTQTSLKETLEGMTYAVLPENSNDHRRLGCVGSMCSLHISPFGLSLIIQQNRSLVAQWPLRCVKTFEASGKGYFTFEAGRHAPFGPGVYEFQTRRFHDQEMYDLLDHYVSNATSLTQNAPNNVVPDVFSEIVEEYNRLKRLTIINVPSSKTSGLVRNSGIYDHIYNQDRESGSLASLMASLERSGVVPDPEPPALPPRPPLAALNRLQSDFPSRNVQPNKELDDRAATVAAADVDPSLPPLPPRNPRRNSRPASQVHQYEDPDLAGLPARKISHRHNYQDIDEIIDSLPPAPPPPNFTPPTPPGHKQRPFNNFANNNYEEIPNMPPPPIPINEDDQDEALPVINPYEDLNQFPPPAKSPSFSIGMPDDDQYFTVDSDGAVREPKHTLAVSSTSLPPQIGSTTRPMRIEEDTYFTMYDDNPAVSKDEATPELRRKPNLAPKPPKPSVLPKPARNKIEQLRKASDDFSLSARDQHLLQAQNKAQSMYEIQAERPKLVKKHSLPKFDDGPGQYQSCQLTEGPKLTLPKSEVGPNLIPPTLTAGRRASAPSSAAASKINQSSMSFIENKSDSSWDYLDMVVPVADKVEKASNTINANREQDIYFDMTASDEKSDCNRTDENDVYFDMSSSNSTTPSPTKAPHALGLLDYRSERSQDDMYFDMSGIGIRITDLSEGRNQLDGSAAPPTKHCTPLPFDVMNLSDFEKRMLSRSTDDLDAASDEDIMTSSVPRMQRSLSNPALGEGKASKSRLSSFLYGTLRKKGRKKKKKEADEEEEREGKFQKNRSYRASTGRRHKKVDKDIKMASNARSFVKSPIAGEKSQTKRATYGAGELDKLNIEIQMCERDGHETADIDASASPNLSRRRQLHAVSTPNLL